LVLEDQELYELKVWACYLHRFHLSRRRTNGATVLLLTGTSTAHSLGGFGFSPAGSTSGARMKMTTNILSSWGSYRKQRYGWS